MGWWRWEGTQHLGETRGKGVVRIIQQLKKQTNEKRLLQYMTNSVDLKTCYVHFQFK